MHSHVTHNRYYEDFRTFAEAIMRFFTTTLPQGWGTIRDTVNDNFHIIRPRNFGSSGRRGITCYCRRIRWHTPCACVVHKVCI